MLVALPWDSNRSGTSRHRLVCNLSRNAGDHSMNRSDPITAPKHLHQKSDRSPPRSAEFSAEDLGALPCIAASRQLPSKARHWIAYLSTASMEFNWWVFWCGLKEKPRKPRSRPVAMPRRNSSGLQPVTSSVSPGGNARPNPQSPPKKLGLHGIR